MPDSPHTDAGGGRKAEEVREHIISLIGVTCHVAVKAPGELRRSQGGAMPVGTAGRRRMKSRNCRVSAGGRAQRHPGQVGVIPAR